MKPLYSICVTNYDSANSVRQSLDSILIQIDERFEIIVVDNQSTDGSLEILREYEKKNLIKLIIRRCSRGLGRRIAVNHSVGRYVISQMDMDDVFDSKLGDLLKIYHTFFDGSMLLVSGVPGLMIAPKKLIEDVGGYRDLNYLEDKDLYSRAAHLGRFRFLKSFKIVAHSSKSRSLSSRILNKVKKEYYIFREAFRIGYGSAQLLYFLRLRLLSTKNSLFLPGDLLLAFWGFITHNFYPCYHNDFVNAFSAECFQIDTNESDLQISVRSWQ